MTESEPNECRICYDTLRQDSMISPCNCSGSMKYVHKQCLLSWINTMHGLKCHVCGIQYRCRLTVKRPHFWSFVRQDFRHFLGDFLVLMHICFVLICSQILGVYVLNAVFKHKCSSIHLSDRLMNKLCKVLVANVMVISTSLNTFCFIIFWSEFRQLVVDRWNQFSEFSFSE